MAFCKNCGKEISEGTLCEDCAKTEAANAAVNAADAVADTNSNNGGNDAVKKLIPVCAAVVVVLIILIALLGGSGAKGAVKDFAKSMTSKKGAKTYYKVTLLDDAIKEIKDDDDWDDMIEDYNDEMEDMLDEGKIKVKKIEKKDKLSNKECKAAEEYFNEEQCEEYDLDDVDVKKGYEYKIKFKYKEDGDDDWDTESQKVCVVKVKGDGWKVIMLEADDLVDSYGD